MRKSDTLRFILAMEVLLVSLFYSCQSNPSTLNLGSGNDVIVTIMLKDVDQIEKMNLKWGKDEFSLNTFDIKGYDQIDFGFENSGEGNFSIAVTFKNRRVEEELYVEKGNRPVIECTKDSIHVLEAIGYNLKY